MTDKEIIIDDVDVSGWTDEEVRYKFEKHSPKAIRQIAFDLYKQLKRKEQECETLVCQLDFEVQKKECLEQECEKLKEDRERWKSNFNGKVSAIEELLQQLDQFKQILAKIKEICNNNDELQGDFNLVDCDKYKLGKHNLANKILQKISEVENDT